jgi:AcrR family transcriptional regulator
MRITEQQKQDVRRRILDEARTLFARREPSSVTTRDVALGARIAHGTLFNYFATKDALVLELVALALEDGRARFRERRRPGSELVEDLFLLVASELDALRSVRALAAHALERALTPLAPAGGTAARVRDDELALLCEVFASHGQAAPAPVVLHVYWSLYLGLLAAGARDASPNQEDTLALLDETTRLWVALIGAPRPLHGDSP